VGPRACPGGVEKNCLPPPGIELNFSVLPARNPSLIPADVPAELGRLTKKWNIRVGLDAVGSVWVLRLAPVKLLLSILSYSEIMRKCAGEC
jgi:hypothetical protein